jgi:phenylacetate-CoA ligase
VFPMACLNAVQSDRRTTGQWLCVVDHVGEGRSARDEMTIRVESVSSDVAADTLRPDLEKHLREDLGVRVTVEVVPAGSLADLTNHGREGKVRRLLDRRPGYKRLY